MLLAATSAAYSALVPPLRALAPILPADCHCAMDSNAHTLIDGAVALLYTCVRDVNTLQQQPGRRVRAVNVSPELLKRAAELFLMIARGDQPQGVTVESGTLLMQCQQHEAAARTHAQCLPRAPPPLFRERPGHMRGQGPFSVPRPGGQPLRHFPANARRICGAWGRFQCPGRRGATPPVTLVLCFCYMSSVRSTSDGRGPVTRKRVPDREEPGKPRKDARRGRCHPLE